jgi:hypothetical protein
MAGIFLAPNSNTITTAMIRISHGPKFTAVLLSVLTLLMVRGQQVLRLSTMPHGNAQCRSPGTQQTGLAGQPLAGQRSGAAEACDGPAHATRHHPQDQQPQDAQHDARQVWHHPPTVVVGILTKASGR